MTGAHERGKTDCSLLFLCLFDDLSLALYFGLSGPWPMTKCGQWLAFFFEKWLVVAFDLFLGAQREKMRVCAYGEVLSVHRGTIQFVLSTST